MTEHAQYGLSQLVINRINAVFFAHTCIEKALLYGSRAMGRERNNSDIDLCLVAPACSLSERLAIENELDELLLPYKIDLSLMHEIDNPALREHIDRVGVTFYFGGDSNSR